MIKPDLSQCHRILAMRTDRIGDLLVTTPCLHALRLALPQARIDLLASSLNAPAAQGNPDVDEIYMYNRRNPLSWPSLLWRLRKNSYDAVLAFNSNSRNGTLLMSLLGAPQTVAFAGLPSHKGRTLEQYGRYYTWMSEHSGKEHVLEDLMGRLEALGVPAVPPQIVFNVPVDQCAAMAARFPQKPGLFRLAVFIGNIKKIHNRWPIEKFYELTQRLLAASEAPPVSKGAGGLSGLELVIFAGPSDRPLLSAFDQIQHPRLHIFVGDTLQESGAFLQTCHGLVVGSSGPAHVAAALGVPMLSLVTEYNQTFWRPLGPFDVCVTPPPELGKDMRDMRGISVDTVEIAVRQFVESVIKQAN